jgi:biotin carboxylase
MKPRLLILGGSDIQVSAILMAKEMGIYVITCDYLPNNPGHKYADEYHNVSTTDLEGVLKLSISLKLDGILAYASDPAALTAAFVSEKLNLPSNSFEVVKMYSRKDLFRAFLRTNGFNAPRSFSDDNYEILFEQAKSLKNSFIIKPVDSSGSKGVFKLSPGADFEYEFGIAKSYSRAGIVIIEEFIDKKGYQIGGDGFVVDGQLVFRCFGDIHFSKTNPLLPCSVSMPTLHEEYIVKKVHEEIQKLLTVSGLQMGALNFDVMVDQNDQVYILEIGPRNGGNMIPELTKYCTGVDMKIFSIKSALGMNCSDLAMDYELKYFSHYVVHSQKSGIVSSVEKSELLTEKLLYEHFNFTIGDKVDRFESSQNRLGILLLKYTNKEEMIDIINNMDKHLQIVIE